MARAIQSAQPTRAPTESVEEHIARVDAMSIGELRAHWRDVFCFEPPLAFSKNLLSRAIAYRLQEEAYGGLSASTARLLRSFAKHGAEPLRWVKVGSVIVREHKGVLHEVMVVPRGFCWRGKTYDSLSTIARKITGVSWNGPRFFGLRPRKAMDAGADSSEAAEATSTSKENQRSSRLTTKKASWSKQESSSRAGRRSSIRTGERR